MFSFSWLDLKLGFRLLRKFPGLTLLGGFALAFAIAIGAGAFDILKQLIDPTLPLAEGDRIVTLHNMDLSIQEIYSPEAHEYDHALVLRDFSAWRELTAVQDLGMYRTAQRNLAIGADHPEPVGIAEITASAFRVTRVQPVLGRFLLESDHAPDAARVIVIGHDIWRSRFGSDPDVVGRVVRVGREPATIVGVMPNDYAFPLAHAVWMPLQLDALEREPPGGENLYVFGRLAPGMTREAAQAQLDVIGARARADHPATHEHLRPQIVRYADAYVSFDVPEKLRPLFYAINLVFVLLLVLIAANVALLMFARAATRESEIVVRHALGASRARIIVQLFTEALVLGAVAAVVGLAMAQFAVSAWLRMMTLELGGEVPFWIDDRLSPWTVVYSALLAIIAAVIAGVLPALKMTGRRVDANLRALAAGGGGLRLGNVWTLIVIVQVTVTVTFPAIAFFSRHYVRGIQNLDVGFPSHEYLSARLHAERDPAEDASSRAEPLLRELERRLNDLPTVSGVTFTNRLPRTPHPRLVVMEDSVSATASSDSDRAVASAAIDLTYLDVLGANVLDGRGFRAADVTSDANVVIVNESFVRRILNGRNPIGRQFRFEGDEPQPWYEIVGVVKDLGTIVEDPANLAGVYHPLKLTNASVVNIALHVRDDPASFSADLRAAAAAVDPALRVEDVMPLDEVGADMWLELNFLFKLLASASGIALLLSLASIYAVTAFAVARRTREIGIRVALGAPRRSIMASIFGRPLAHVAVGVIAGGVFTALFTFGTLPLEMTAAGVSLVLAYALTMLAVCALGCLVPTRRALSIEPTEALRTLT